MAMLLKSCEKNADSLNLNKERLFVHASAHKGSIMRRRRRRSGFGSRMKMTNLEIILIERGKPSMITKQAKPAQKAEDKKTEHKDETKTEKIKIEHKVEFAGEKSKTEEKITPEKNYDELQSNSEGKSGENRDRTTTKSRQAVLKNRRFCGW